MSSNSASPRLWSYFAYAVLLVAGVGAFLLIRAYGETLSAPVPAAASVDKAKAHVKVDMFHILLALAAVIAAGQGLGRLVKLIGQPPVIGEVAAGILLGPTLLGRLSPEAYHFLLPESVVPYLEAVAQLGVILYMFLVGLELNASLPGKRARTTVAISHASILCPFILASVLALWLYPRLSSSDVPFTSFALFFGVAMSITAFPVLARILTDRKLTQTELGQTALMCAAFGDVTAWCLLALVVGVVQARVDQLGIVFLGTAAFVAFLYFAVQPAVAWATRRFDRGRLSTGVAALVFIGLLLSALATEAIGIHALFGAFLFGAVIPHDGTVAREFTRRTTDVATIFLLPAFFALTGMRALINFNVENGLLCALITLTATAGKFGGTFGAARWTGFNGRTSTALGLLMNTRGLMELIVLNVGLQLKVISPTLFAMMVLMALITTMATPPLLKLLEWSKPSTPLVGAGFPRPDCS